MVALPWLVLSARGGPVLLGTVLACYGVPRTALIPVGGILADKFAPRATMLAADAVRAVLVTALAVFAVSHVASLAALAVACLVLGACSGFGNVTMITMLQRWAPKRLLGRVMSLVMLASMGTFPVSVAVSGVLVRGLGPVAFFPVAGLVLALAILGALSQRELREFGMAGRPG